MTLNEKLKKYAAILDIVAEMKTDVTNTFMQDFMIYGTPNEKAQKEIKVLSQITGSVFNAMISNGTDVFEDKEKENVVCTTIEGVTYFCAKDNVNKSVSISAAPISASETMAGISESHSSAESGKKVSIEEFESKEEPVEIQEQTALPVVPEVKEEPQVTTPLSPSPASDLKPDDEEQPAPEPVFVKSAEEEKPEPVAKVSTVSTAVADDL